MSANRYVLLGLLPLLLTTTACASVEEDVLGKIFPRPTEETITAIPKEPLALKIEKEVGLRRFKNPEELELAVGALDYAEKKEASVVPEDMQKSVLANGYVYRAMDTGFSYGKLGETQLPVRVTMLGFAPRGIAQQGNILVLAGTSEGKTQTAVVDITAPAAPKVLSNTTADGNLMAVRFAPGTAFVVLRGVWKDAMTIPAVYEDNQPRTYDYKRVGCACPALYGFSRAYSHAGYVHVVTLPLVANAQAEQYVVAVSDDQQVHVASQALYIGYRPQETEEDVRLEVLASTLAEKLDGRAKLQYTEIMRAPDYILTPEEREEKQLRLLEREKDALAQDAQTSIERDVAAQLEEQMADFEKKTQVTIMHKLRFDEGKLQYVSAAVTQGTPHDTLQVGEYAEGTWLLSRAPRSGTGSVLHTLDTQMQPKGDLLLENIVLPLVRRARETELWVTTSGSAEASILNLSTPELVGQQTLTQDERMIPVGENRVVQVSKGTDGVVLRLLDTSGETKELAKQSLTGSGAYSRLFDELTAAYYHPAQKMLIIHVEEIRRAGSSTGFDGVMLFAVGENTLEKKAEFDLRSGMGQVVADTDVQVLPVSDTEVAVLYGKTASLINTAELKETVRKVLQ